MKRWEFIAGLGGAVAWPLVARAQQVTTPVIGYLAAATYSPLSLAAFHRGLAEHGYIEGHNIVIVYRWLRASNARCCARAASGQATAPPSPATNSRRLIR
jgi:putative tryptophan/tyrosine transport system substrate-binding protein